MFIGIIHIYIYIYTCVFKFICFFDWFVYLFTYISHKHQLNLSQPCYSQFSYSLGAMKNIELLVLTFEICRVYNDYYRFAGMTMGIWWLIDPGSTDWMNTLARSLFGRRYHPAAVRWLDHVRSPIFGWVKTRCLLAWVQFIDCHPHAACLQCFLTTLHNQWFWDDPLEAAIERKASPIKHGAVMSSLSPCNGAICVFGGEGDQNFTSGPHTPSVARCCPEVLWPGAMRTVVVTAPGSQQSCKMCRFCPRSVDPWNFLWALLDQPG